MNLDKKGGAKEAVKKQKGSTPHVHPGKTNPPLTISGSFLVFLLHLCSELQRTRMEFSRPYPLSHPVR